MTHFHAGYYQSFYYYAYFQLHELGERDGGNADGETGDTRTGKWDGIGVVIILPHANRTFISTTTTTCAIISCLEVHMVQGMEANNGFVDDSHNAEQVVVFNAQMFPVTRLARGRTGKDKTPKFGSAKQSKALGGKKSWHGVALV